MLAQRKLHARGHQVEVFNGQDTRDGVNILIMGVLMVEGQITVLRHAETLLWY